ncbi:MAG: PorV/PorQ family protein [Bacteroidetes bacterium]|nr:PorV/PorQ family protein [Bacteroidota bacterium]MCH8524650.1 PorV/PorQ family protein [Balneolales bacterium]
MNKHLSKLLIATLLLSVFTFVDSYAQEKRAQTTMKFLSAPLSARATGMGDAVTAVETGSMGIFYNPAALGFQESLFDVSMGNVSWIADIDYQYAALTFRPRNGLYGVFGLSMMSTNYGEMTETVRQDSELGYQILGTFSPSAFAFGVTYAKAISNQFSVGGNVRYAELDLANAITARSTSEPDGFSRERFKADTFTIDFGVLFKTGFESLNFAMSLRNYSREISYIRDTQELPLTFRIGLAMDILDLTSVNQDLHRLIVSVDANRPRDYYEQLMIGAEYTFANRIHLRSGYVFPSDEQDFSFGVGVSQGIADRYGIKADFSHSAFGNFSNVNRLSIQLSF